MSKGNNQALFLMLIIIGSGGTAIPFLIGLALLTEKGGPK